MSVDLVTLEQKVKERIKNVISESIPEEVWDKIVHDMVNSFIKADLPGLIKAELTDYFKKLIYDEMQKPEWSSKWSGSRKMASDMVEQIIKNSAGDMVR